MSKRGDLGLYVYFAAKHRFSFLPDSSNDVGGNRLFGSLELVQKKHDKKTEVHPNLDSPQSGLR